MVMAYMLPSIRRFKQRYDFAKSLPGPSILDVIAAARKGSNKTDLK